MTNRLTQLLHNEIDQAEDLSAQAEAIARRVLRQELPIALKIAEQQQSKRTSPTSVIDYALELLVVRVAEALAGLTTKAVHLGAKAAKARQQK